MINNYSDCLPLGRAGKFLTHIAQLVRSSKGTERAAPVPTKFEVGLWTRFLRPWVKGELERERLPLEEEDLEEGEQDEFELPETDPDLDREVSEFETELSSLRPPGDRDRLGLRRPSWLRRFPPLLRPVLVRDFVLFEDDLWGSRSPTPAPLLDDDEPCPFKRLNVEVVNLLSPPPVLSEDDIGLAMGPFLSCNLVSPWLLEMSVLFRYCAAFAADAADVVWSEVTESPETGGNIVLTIRPAGLLLPDEGVIALFVTGLAELIAGDEDGESFQLDPLP